MENTQWENYGVGRNPKCDNCMAHCGYEGTAVEDTFKHPLKALKVMMKGPDLTGDFAEELPILYGDRAQATATRIPISSIGRRSASDAGKEKEIS